MPHALRAQLAVVGATALAETSLDGRIGECVHDEIGVEEVGRRVGGGDPEGFLTAAARVGVEPARCIVIEDAPAGLRAAKSGGMRAIGVTTTHPAADLFDADLVVDTLADPSVKRFFG